MGTHPIFESDFDCLTEMQSVRHQVLREYRKIYRAIKRATPDDLHATLTLQGNSRDEFRKNASLTDSAEIEKQIQLAKDVAQFVEYEPNKYKSNFRPELEWMDDANRPKGGNPAGQGCQLPPVIEPRRKRKRIPIKN